MFDELSAAVCVLHGLLRNDFCVSKSKSLVGVLESSKFPNKFLYRSQNYT